MIEQDSCQSRLWRGTRNCLCFGSFRHDRRCL